MKANEWCRYREGVTVGRADDPMRTHGAKVKKGHSNDSGAQGSTFVECRLPARVRIPVDVPPDSRVTIKFDSSAEAKMDAGQAQTLNAEVVAPDAPREEAGYYWGYSCRMAASLSAVFTEAPYEGGYDLGVGTSERGVPVTALTGGGRSKSTGTEDVTPVPNDWKHMVLVFGGVAGLETALKADGELLGKGVTDVKDVFDYWVNLVPDQGSRTIRTEEAVWLGLMGTRQLVVDRSK